MSALNERPNAEPLPASSGVAILQNGHYLPPPEDKDGRLWVRTTALVQRSSEDLYAMWRALENAPLWQERIETVEITGTTTSNWTMRDGDRRIHWKSEILADEPGKRIAWHTVEGDIDAAGEVVFEPAPGGRGTIVCVLMAFSMGKLASAWESIVSRNPKQGVIENLRHFKALAETGEIPNSQTAPHGDRGALGKATRSVYGETIPTPAATAAK